MDKLGIVFVAYLLLAAFGGAIALLPTFSRYSVFARLAIALLTGSVLLTVAATSISIAGYAWSPAGLAASALIATAAVYWSVPDDREPPLVRRPGLTECVAWAGAAAALAHLAASIATTRSTSVDYVFFWGVKAARFADARAIDADLLRWQFFNHAVPEYPPLVPVTQAWAAMLAGAMPWFVVPLTTVLWIAAAAPLVAELLHDSADPGLSSFGAAFWTAALALSMAYSISGGNAESLLVAFVTVAGAATTVIHAKRGAASVAALAMAGAVLTKVEAIIPVAALLVGIALVGALRRSAARIRLALWVGTVPALALLLWFTFQWSSGLPVGYRGHGELTKLHWQHLGAILAAFPANLQAGSWWIAWIAPLIVITTAIARDRRRMERIVPLLLATLLLFAFFVFDYLHDAGDPTERIGWTLPRIAQPALSLLIVAAIAASGPGRLNSPQVPDRPGSSE